MSCSENDWKAYALDELGAAEKRAADTHLAVCANCREELAGVQSTLTVMSALHEEEVPRRIAFVSDKVFEPKWWQRFLNPTFASACLLAAAILFHGAMNHGPSAADVQARIDKAVSQATQDRNAQMQAAYDQLDNQIRQYVRSNQQLVSY